MMTRVRLILLLMLAVGGTASAQRLPDHYPEGFQRTGTVDDVQTGTIIINDVPYQLSASVLIHSLYQDEVPVSRVRKGTLVGYRIGDNRQIAEIWLLPANYDVARTRR